MSEPYSEVIKETLVPSPKNVLLLVDRFDTGGAETQMLLLARLLLESNLYRVHFACLRHGGALFDEARHLNGSEIPEFPLTSFYDRNMVKQLRRFAALLREREVDVVHTEGFYTNVFGITGAALARVPARVAFRGETGGWRTSKQNFVEQGVFRLSSVIHANSEAVKHFLIKEGVAPDKITVIYNGLDMARVTPSPDLKREDTLATFGLPVNENRRFVTIVANMRHEVKDHPMFLRAARRVRAAMPEAAFVLAGEGELEVTLRALAAELGLERDVFFTGRCDNVAGLLFASDICVLSSKAEGFSNSILEYMGAARPVVATDVGGAREAIIEDETGYLVQSGDDEMMAARIISLLREPARAQAMGEMGRRRVQQNFSAQVQLERTHALYERLLIRTQRLGRTESTATLHKTDASDDINERSI